MAKEKDKKKEKSENKTRFFKEFRSEVKKIVWPTISATFINKRAVLSAIVIIGVIVALLDFLFKTGLRLVMNMG